MSAIEVFINACAAGTLRQLPNLATPILHDGFNVACAYDHVRIVRLFSNSGIFLDTGFIYAIVCRSLTVIEYLIDFIDTSALLYIGFAMALKNKHIDIALYIVNTQKLKPCHILQHAAQIDDVDYMRIALNLGAKNFVEALQVACFHGSEKALDLLLNSFPISGLDFGMMEIGRGGHLHILTAMLKRLSTAIVYIPECFLGACAENRLEMIKFITGSYVLSRDILTLGLKIAHRRKHYEITPMFLNL